MSGFSLVTITHLFAIFLYFNLATIILYSDPKSRINRLAALMTLCFAFWSINELALTNTSINIHTAYVIERVNSIGWILSPVFLGLFLLNLSEDFRIISAPAFRMSVFLLPAIMLYLSFTDRFMDMPILRKYCWYSDWKEPWFYLYVAYMLFFTCFPLYRLVRYSIKTTNSLKRTQARVMIFVTMATVITGTLLQIILPNLLKGKAGADILNLTNSYLVIWAAGSMYAVVRYRFLRITPTDAADDIVNNMTDTLIILDSDLNVVFVNESALHILKYDKGELTGKPFSELITTNDFIHLVSGAGVNKNVDLNMLDSNGSHVLLNFSVSVLHGKDKPRGFVLVARDIRERLEYEEQIKKERDRAKAYLETAGVMFVILDRSGNVIMVNKKTLDVLELVSETQIVDRNWSDNFLPENFRSKFNDIYTIAMNGLIKETGTSEVITSRGEIRLIKWNTALLRDEQGHVTGLLSAGLDITEERRNEEQVQKFSTAVNQSPSSIVITDLDGKITYVNPKFTSVTGYSYYEALGRNPRILKSGELTVEKYKELWDAITSGHEWHGEFHNVRKDGTLFWESASISPIKNNEGKTIAYIAIKDDITEQKRVQNELKKNYEKLKELDVLKASFMSMVSHELRTPITSIKGFLAFLLGGVAGPITAQQREYLDIMKNNSERLLNLINDLLDVTKMEAGSFTITKAEADLIGTIKTVIKDTSSLASRKKIRVTCDSPHPSIVFSFDDYRIAQTLINLINNSIKFSPEASEIKVLADYADFDGISVPEYVRHDIKPGSRVLKLTVKDQGVGLTPENAQKVFSRFYQVENINTRKQQGTGLGLSIVKSITELHGGCVWAESDGPGFGSSFIVLLPL